MPKKQSAQKADPLELIIEKRSILRFFLIAGILLIIWNVFVLNSLFYAVDSNALLSEGALPYILEMLIQLCNILLYTLSFTVLIYSVCFFSKRHGVIITCICLSFGINFGDLIRILIVKKALRTDQISIAAINLCLDMILLAIAYGIIRYSVKSFQQRKRQRVKDRATLRKTTVSDEEPSLYPFTKLYRKNNLLQRSALITSILLSCTRIASRVIADVFAGWPTSVAEAFGILAYYGSDILIILISYLASLLLFTYFFKIKERVAKKSSVDFLATADEAPKKQ